MHKSYILVYLALAFSKLKECQSYHHVCYFTNWSQFGTQARRLPPAQVPSHLCTHLVYVYAKLRDTSIEPTEYNDFNMYARIVRLKTPNGTLQKILLGLGGYAAGGQDFSRLVQSTEAMQEMSHNLVAYLRRYRLDGVHLDWQYPTLRDRGGSARDRVGYTALLRTIRQLFKEESRTSGREPLILSAALEPDFEDARTYYQIQQIGSLLDFACLMAYDMHGYWNLTGGPQHHSPLLPEIRSYTMSWLGAGFRPDKLVMAISASGRSFTLSSAPEGSGIGQAVTGAGRVGDRSRQKGLLDYGEICELLESNSWRQAWLPDRRVPVAMGNSSGDWQWVGYDDPQSCAQKAEFVKTESLAGVALWTLEHDDFHEECGQGRWPLLQALWNQLNLPVEDPPATTSPSDVDPEQLSTSLSPPTVFLITTRGLTDPTVDTPLSSLPTAVTSNSTAYPRLDTLDPGIRDLLNGKPLHKLWSLSSFRRRLEGSMSKRRESSHKRCKLADNYGPSLTCPSNRGVPGKSDSFYLYCIPGLLAMECCCLPGYFYNRCRHSCDLAYNHVTCLNV